MSAASTPIVTITLAQGETLGVPVFALAYAPTSAHLTVRAALGAPVALVDLTDAGAPGARLVLDAGARTVAPDVAAATTAAWAPAVYVFDLFALDAAGTRRREYTGTLTVVQAVTEYP